MYLTQLAESFRQKEVSEKTKALQLAKEKAWRVKYEENGSFFELMKVSEEGKPIYYRTFNADAAISTRANTLNSGGLLGLNLNGQNMVGHVWDAGLARSTHQEYDGSGGNNRFSIGDGTSSLHYHSAHVTGTIIASGVQAIAKGMAPHAHAVGYDWNTDLSEATTAANNGMLLSNHSYGYILANLPDWYIGAYGDDARDWDILHNNAPYYLMVVAAGNDGDDNSSNGSPNDGNSSYDKLSGHATAKNNLVVANAQDANIDANGNLISVTINSGSSEGPTDDYRIKPDITGNGTLLYSTFESSDTDYNTITGTSMASPNVMGTLLLLQQHYNNIKGNFMRAASLKGLALHTADDAGPTGPDAVYGWGLLNAKDAANVITDEGTSSVIEENSLANGQSYQIQVVSDGVNDLLVSISWNDPAGVANTGTSNDHTPSLVNDLDVRVTQGANTYLPYKLTSVNSNALGDNTVDPFERIRVNAASGTYTITVNHKGVLNSVQDFTLIVTGIIVNTNMPVVTTTDASSITTTSAVSGGNVISEGATAVTERGIVWSLSPNPTTADNKIMDANGGTGSYAVTITGLTPSTTYYVRAYAINSHGTSYGDNKSFTTSCGIIDTFPFTEGFEGGSLPNCWTNEHVIDTQDWAYQSGGHIANPTNAHSGSNNAYFYNASTTANITKLVTPQLDLSSAVGASLNFWHAQEEWPFDQDELRVYYKNASGGAWSLLATYTSNIPNWTERTINLPNLTGDYYIAFEATGQYGYGVVLDDVTVDRVICTANTTTWNGTAWSNGMPDATKPTIINANYDSDTGNLDCCSLTVNAGSTITVKAGKYINIKSDFENNGTIIIQHEGSLVQEMDTPITGSGSYEIHKTTPTYLDYDYTYWSSPMQSESIGNVFATNPASYIFSLNTANFLDRYSGGHPQTTGTSDTFDDNNNDWQHADATTVMQPGKGYITMGAGSAFPLVLPPTDTQTQSVVFNTGKVNNGNISVPVTLDEYNQTNLNTPGTYTGADSFHTNANLIGNPYPSAIDISLLRTDPANASILEGSFYFWTHDTAIATGGGPWAWNFTNDDYSTVGVDAGGVVSITGAGNNTGTSANRYIASCQGFLANVTGNGNVTFTNSMRVTGNNTHFLSSGTEETEIDKFWLNLTNAEALFRQILIGFYDTASDGYQAGQDVARLENGNNVDFYSLIAGDERHFAIQNLASFSNEKTIPLGLKLIEAGMYSIALDQVVGLFEHQNVFLYDSKNNQLLNLSNAPYKFYVNEN